jgi:hypothetical protein
VNGNECDLRHSGGAQLASKLRLVQNPIELPRNGWMTLAAAAERLGVSPWEARRWVRDGRLHAELRRGPDGSHYYVPTPQLDELALELALADPPPADPGPSGDPRDLEDDALVQALVQLRAEVQQAVEFHEASEAALREELSQIRQELAAGIEALKMARVVTEEPAPPSGRKWWPFR